MNQGLPQQKWFLGDKVKIEGIEYTISLVEFATNFHNQLDIRYGLRGPVFYYYFSDRLDDFMGIKVQERKLSNLEFVANFDWRDKHGN